MKKVSLIMILAALLFASLYVLPLWTIMIGAPQYPEPLGIHIHIDGIQDVSEFDIQNIDTLNHYIGMSKLPKPEDMWEFSTFPIIVGVIIITGLIIGILNMANILSHKWFLYWFVITIIAGILGMYDFNLWLNDYGTNLDPKAILKLVNKDGSPITYKPPLFGFVKMLNFDVSSLPASGSYMMFTGMGLSFIAFLLGKKKK